MGRTKGVILVSLLAIAVVLAGSSTILSALAQDQRTLSDPQLPPREPPWMDQLTDDQKEELQQLVESLKASGASREDVRDAINAKLQEWGIEVPTPPQTLGQ
jgi:hypothetical protein